MRVLTMRALNRATLARQHLLERSRRPVTEVVEHLVGVQAQEPHSWYVGLWSRVHGIRPEDVADLLGRRMLVRIALMRSTIHLVTARDCLPLRRVVQPVVERSLNGNFGRYLSGLELDTVVAAGRQVVEEQPRTFSEIGRILAQRWPDRDPNALAQAVRAHVPLVQVPPRGLWGKSGRALHTSAEAWLNGASDHPLTVDDLMMRYLAAFGPASVGDMRTWSGLTGLREVVERLRPRLATYRDERGRELFDLPEAPRPDLDAPAPVRFLYDFDNLLLSHADRARVISEEGRLRGFVAEGTIMSIVLVDGFTAGSWSVEHSRARATLTVRPFIRLSSAAVDDLTVEGARLLDFVAAGADHDVRVTAPSG